MNHNVFQFIVPPVAGSFGAAADICSNIGDNVFLTRTSDEQECLELQSSIDSLELGQNPEASACVGFTVEIQLLAL